MPSSRADFLLAALAVVGILTKAARLIEWIPSSRQTVGVSSILCGFFRTLRSTFGADEEFF